MCTFVFSFSCSFGRLVGFFVGFVCGVGVLLLGGVLFFGEWGWGGVECVQYNYIIISASHPCYQIGYVEPIGIILYINLCLQIIQVSLLKGEN